jgi:hypothetical protein
VAKEAEPEGGDVEGHHACDVAHRHAPARQHAEADGPAPEEGQADVVAEDEAQEGGEGDARVPERVPDPAEGEQVVAREQGVARHRQQRAEQQAASRDRAQMGLDVGEVVARELAPQDEYREREDGGSEQWSREGQQAFLQAAFAPRIRHRGLLPAALAQDTA